MRWKLNYNPYAVEVDCTDIEAEVYNAGVLVVQAVECPDLLAVWAVGSLGSLADGELFHPGI